MEVNMKKVTGIGIVGVLLVLLAASAFAGFGGRASRSALDSGDFDSWKSAMASQLTEENFARLRERHTSMGVMREEMDSAMQQGYESWKAYLEQSGRGKRMLSVVTPENFGNFVAMHKARQQGNFDEANILAQQLGFVGSHKQGCLGHR